MILKQWKSLGAAWRWVDPYGCEEGGQIFNARQTNVTFPNSRLSSFYKRQCCKTFIFFRNSKKSPTKTCVRGEEAAWVIEKIVQDPDDAVQA